MSVHTALIDDLVAEIDADEKAGKEQQEADTLRRKELLARFALVAERLCPEMERQVRGFDERMHEKRGDRWQPLHVRSQSPKYVYIERRVVPRVESEIVFVHDAACITVRNGRALYELRAVCDRQGDIWFKDIDTPNGADLAADDVVGRILSPILRLSASD